MELRSGALPDQGRSAPLTQASGSPAAPRADSQQTAGTTIPPPLQPFNIWHPSTRQRDPKHFSGLGEEEIEEWLDLYERISAYNRWDNASKLANIIFYFTDVAKTWYLNHETEWQTWDDFTNRAKDVFGRPENRRAIADRRLTYRVQQPTESYTSYIEDVLSLCRRANPQMEESERVRHLLKGISEEAFRIFITNPPNDVNTVVNSCTRLTEARTQRVHDPITTPWIPGQPPPPTSYIPASAVHTPAPDVLRAMIRDIIREELHQLFTQPSALPSSHAPIPQLIRDELSRAMNTPIPTPSQQPPPRISYAEITARTPTPTTTAPTVALPPFIPPAPVASLVDPHIGHLQYNSWHNPNPRPTCYYCGVIGHVMRYCRRRRSDEEREWSQQPRYRSDESPNRSFYNRRYQSDESPSRSFYNTNRRADQGYNTAVQEPRYTRRQSLSPYRRRSASPMLSAANIQARPSTEN
ncbi:hypothetical protein HPB47_010870 [Ixodes persulcatus]|uniref:Uncharacterized protein n=1 Tax=Ixodes persulcatus TaxID=34615 RepID=A0AC60NXU0_IXOPE|nr:hypothetical protein HPB47_010870 [Ixodes persulcatus]